jgi:hypothetical protein
MNNPMVVVEKTSTLNGKKTASTRYYLSSLDCAKSFAARFGELIRGHWGGCENRNHWVRDHLVRKDDTPSKNWNINFNLAITRAAVLYLKGSLIPGDSWVSVKEKADRDASFAFQMVVNHEAK